MVAMSGRAMPAVARLPPRGQEGRREYSRDDRQDARREYAGGARQDGRREPGRDDRQQDRRGEYNYNSRDSRSQGRPEYARDDRRDGRFDGRREQGHAGRGDERHGQRAYQDGPSGQNRQGPVSTAAATTAISVESVMAVRAPSAAMDAQARIPVRRPATAVREAGRPAHRSRRAHASPMPPFASTRCSACWARSCNGPIRRTRPCRTGCAAIPAWAPATAPKSPKPSTTCCGICGATASTVKAALARPRAVWPSWAWPPRWARRNWPKGWTRPRPNGCSACRASIRPRCRARCGAASPTGWTSVCPPWTARTR